MFNKLERADSRSRDLALVPTQEEYKIAEQRRVVLTGQLIQELRAEAKRKRAIATAPITIPTSKPKAGTGAEVQGASKSSAIVKAPTTTTTSDAATIASLRKQVTDLRKEAADAHYNAAKFKLQAMTQLLNQ